MQAKSNEYMMNIDVYTADWWLKSVMPDGTYIRLQKVTTLPMDKYAPKDLENLKAAGKEMYEERKEELQKILRDIIDSRFNKSF